MSLSRLINQINQISNENFDTGQENQSLGRKQALGKMGGLGKKLAMAAIPFGALAAFSEPAFAKAKKEPVSTIQFALTLEYLESTFYTMAKESGVYSEYADTFDEIQKDEMAHVKFLKGALKKAGVDPVDKPNFDFTLGGKYDPIHNTKQFLLFSMAFEDTGVSAYKGQAADLQDTPYLTPALRIHGVEARHAAAVRRIRDKEAWIPLDQPSAPNKLIKSIYANEDNVKVLGKNVANAVPSSVSKKSVTEAFDEPLTHKQVLDIVAPFIV